MRSIVTNPRNKYALITGATSGIGYELAKLFAKDNYNLVLVARRQDRLTDVANKLKKQFHVEIVPLAKDLFDPGAAKDIYDTTKKMRIKISALVNDAGQGEWGPFADTAPERDAAIIQLNLTSAMALTKYFLRDMLKRNEGKILQVGSEAGTIPSPLLAVYAATKAFILSFSVALCNEIKETDITITVLLPGATDTDFFYKANMEDTVTYREKKLAKPAEVAKDGYEALMRGECKIISGARTKMHVWMSDLLGQKVGAAYIRKHLQRSKKGDGRRQSSHLASQKERKSISRDNVEM